MFTIDFTIILCNKFSRSNQRLVHFILYVSQVILPVTPKIIRTRLFNPELFFIHSLTHIPYTTHIKSHSNRRTNVITYPTHSKKGLKKLNTCLPSALQAQRPISCPSCWGCSTRSHAVKRTCTYTITTSSSAMCRPSCRSG